MVAITRIRQTSATVHETPNKRVLYSYSTPVAIMMDGVCYATTRRFSVTTSRQQNEWVARQHAPLILVSQDEISSLAAST